MIALMLATLAALAAPSTSAEPVNARWAPTEAESFDEQWQYVTSTDLFNAVTCSRRSGKTTGAVKRHAKKLIEAPPGSWTHFGSLIRRNARKHFWNPLKNWFDEHGWEYHANNTEMILELENGNYCQAFGCDDMSGIKAPQGDGSMLFTIDECHLPNDDVLQALVDVATPMLTDRGGMLDLLGLPPEVEGGFFSSALDSGFRVFSWTMFDHDFPRSREEKLADVLERCQRRGLKVEVITTTGPDGRPRYTCGPGTHPLVARQYFGKREGDPEKAAYEYQAGRNDYDPDDVQVTRTELDPFGVDEVRSPWRHAMGLDLGFQDRDAIVVVAWRKDDPERRLYVRHTWQANHQDVDMLAAQVEKVIAEYRPGTIVGDHGGHGAVKVLKTLEARLHIAIQPKPTDVMVSVGLVNDDLRTGRLLLPQGSELAGELARVQRTVNPNTRRVEINKKGYHSDLSEALRYAHHAARHWAAKAPKPAETTAQRRERQWREHEKREARAWR